MISSFLQQFYGAVDSAIVGKFSGPEALAAVGATSSVTHLILALFIGMSTGAGIVVAQLIGAEDKKGISKAVHTAIAISIAGGLFLMVFGTLLSGKVLALMETPEDVFPLAKTYMVIYFFGSVPSLLYNFGSGILRASGDSKNPLKFLCVATVVNIVFNLIFVIVFDMSVAGVAVSTVISQTVSAILVLRLLVKTDEDTKLDLKKIGFNKRMFIKIIKIGLPAGIQSSVFSFSNTIIQSTVNSFGKAAVAGCAASSQIENFVYLIMNSVSVGSTTFIGQNYGAGKLKRCSKGFKICLLLVVAIGVMSGFVLFFAQEPLLKIFTDNPEAISFGKERLTVFAFTYILCGIMDVISCSMRGYGDSFFTMLICVFCVPGSRMLWIFTVLPLMREIFMVYLAFPVSWLLTLTILLIRFSNFKKNFKKTIDK